MPIGTELSGASPCGIWKRFMSLILVLKLILVPALIWGVTLASRRWGPSIGGWLSAFPVVAAPILFFIALEHGAAFTADAALGTLTAVLANVAFGLGYAWSASTLPWASSLIAGFVGYFLAVVWRTIDSSGREDVFQR